VLYVCAVRWATDAPRSLERRSAAASATAEDLVPPGHRLRIFAAAAAASSAAASSSAAAATYCASLAGPPVYLSHRRRDILVKSAISAVVTSYPTLSRHSSAATRLEQCSPPAGLFYQILLILPPAHFILPPLPPLREASRIC
jgi:hypothetical protein